MWNFISQGKYPRVRSTPPPSEGGEVEVWAKCISLLKKSKCVLPWLHCGRSKGLVDQKVKKRLGDCPFCRQCPQNLWVAWLTSLGPALSIFLYFRAFFSSSLHLGLNQLSNYVIRLHTSESFNTATRCSLPSISCVLPSPQCYLASWSAHSLTEVSWRRLPWDILRVDWEGPSVSDATGSV